MRSHLSALLRTCMLLAAASFAGGQPLHDAGAASPALLAQTAPTTPPPSVAPPPAPPPGSTVVVPPEAQGPSVARIRFSGGEVAVGIGFSWGDGTIAYHGVQRPFHISGLSVANVGISSLTATGKVYNLRRLEDFAGNYVEMAAGATVGGGGSVAYLRNERGVVIEITSSTVGLDFQLSSNGVSISLA
jgi:hypothetical protein